MGWFEYILAAAAFLLSHSIPLRPLVRKRAERYMGQRAFLLAYSLLSIAVLAWLIGAAARAPYVQLWPWADWQIWVPQGAMAAVFLITALAIGKPNPFSFGGARNDSFDPAHPGIVGVMRHPLLWAMALWSAAHMVPNGDLAHVAMFGAFTLFALLGMKMIDRRRKRLMGTQWTQLRAQMAGRSGGRALQVSPDLGLRFGLAALAYGAIVWAHPLLFGVYPFP